MTVALLLPGQQPALADSIRGCRPGEQPALQNGFATLKAALGDVMGDPTTCMYFGTSSSYQDTTTGRAYYRFGQIPPSFTDGSTYWTLTDSGTVQLDGTDPLYVSPAGQPPSSAPPSAPVAQAAPASPVAAQPVQPAAAPVPPPAVPVRQRPTAVIALAGVGSNTDGIEQRAALWGSLLPSATIFPYSYAGGSWSGNTWTWLPYDKWATYQDLDQSAANLRNEVSGLKARGNRVVVVGFSLGGLVAYQELWTSLLASEDSSRPDAVVTISSPLQGVDPGKRGKCTDILLTGVLGGIARGGTLGLAIAGGGVAADLLCPRDPIASELENIYLDPTYRQQRDAFVMQAARRAGTRLMTIGNANDCLYYLDCVSVFGGGENVRWTPLVQGADVAKLFNVPAPCDSGLNGCISKVHGSILDDPAARQAVAQFVAS